MKIMSVLFPPSPHPQTPSFAITKDFREARSPESEIKRLPPDREGHQGGTYHSEAEEANVVLQKMSSIKRIDTPSST